MAPQIGKSGDDRGFGTGVGQENTTHLSTRQQAAGSRQGAQSFRIADFGFGIARSDVPASILHQATLYDMEVVNLGVTYE